MKPIHLLWFVLRDHTYLLVILLLLSIGLVFVMLKSLYQQTLKRKNTFNVRILKEIKKNCNFQYIKVQQFIAAMDVIDPNDVDPFDVLLVIPECIEKPDTQTLGIYLHFLNRRGKLYPFWKIISVRDSIMSQHGNLQYFLKTYREKIKLNKNSYEYNLIGLSKMHDELGKFVKSKNFDKETGSDWYEGYFNIFGGWFQSGGKMSVAVTYHQIVERILNLNKYYRYIPFVIQTTENALRCEFAYQNIVSLNLELKKELLEYSNTHRFAFKIAQLFIDTLQPSHRKTRLTANFLSPILSKDEKITGVPSWFVPFRQLPSQKVVVWILSGLIIASLISLSILIYDLHSKRKTKTSYQHYLAHRTKIKERIVTKPGVARLLVKADVFKILYDSSAKAVPHVYGIDISRYQGNLIEDLKNLDSLHFLICKATEGTTYVDPDFKKNWKYISERGLIRGAYHFYRSSDPPIEQAKHYLNTTNGLSDTDIPPIIDIEELGLTKTVDVKKLDSELLRLLSYVQEKTKRKPVIYSDLYFANRYLINDSLGKYPLWLAEYSGASKPVLPKVWSKQGYVIWQRRNNYSVNSKNTDFDIFNGDGHALINFIKNID